MAATPAMARGHYHHWHGRHHDHVDGGDVLAGALILGGIAAIASAASQHDRADREPAPPPVPDDRQGYADDGAAHDAGLDRAADLCAGAAERKGNRVDFVDDVTRDGDGWAVSGALEGGAGFACRIGNDGQVRDVTVGGPRAEADDGDAAGDDDNAPPPATDNRPVWHGDQAAPQPQPQDDGRYQTSNAPDFGQGV